jgi:hypothetical protein
MKREKLADLNAGEARHVALDTSSTDGPAVPGKIRVTAVPLSDFGIWLQYSGQSQGEGA